MNASPETFREKLDRYVDKLYLVIFLVFIAVRMIVSIFPQLESILPKEWQTVAIFIILVLLLDKTVKISDETKTSAVDISKKIDEIDKKIDNKQSGSLLQAGKAWHKGAELIDELNAGDTILACNLVSWKTDQITSYEIANKNALKKDVNIKRLYANDSNNVALANLQSEWVKGTKWEKNFERKMYQSSHPMLDYILAIDSGNKPKWAVLWIYMPEDEAEPNILYGFHIVDKKSLEGMMGDFNDKWNNNKLTTVAR